MWTQTPVPLHVPATPDLVESFLARYKSNMHGWHRSRIVAMFRDTGRRDPSQLTESDLIRWVTGELDSTNPIPGHTGRPRTQDGNRLANNSVRQRMITAGEFLAHCRRQGLDTFDPRDTFARLRRLYPRTFGKVQDRNPARRLTKDQAFSSLIGACKDGTWTGSRDQLVIRLGLLGLRADEIVRLTWRNLAEHHLTFTGKGNKAETIILGRTLVSLLTRWRHEYERQIRRPVQPDDPIICTTRNRGRKPGTSLVVWGQPTTHSTIQRIVAIRAQAAGLGHMSPHDLRRTAGTILHNEKSTDGGHRFDLLDIQKVLRHADPVTTMRCYIEPLDTEVKDRAAAVLD